MSSLFDEGTIEYPEDPNSFSPKFIIKGTLWEENTGGYLVHKAHCIGGLSSSFILDTINGEPAGIEFLADGGIREIRTCPFAPFEADSLYIVSKPLMTSIANTDIYTGATRIIHVHGRSEDGIYTKANFYFGIAVSAGDLCRSLSEVTDAHNAMINDVNTNGLLEQGYAEQREKLIVITPYNCSKPLFEIVRSGVEFLPFQHGLKAFAIGPNSLMDLVYQYAKIPRSGLRYVAEAIEDKSLHKSNVFEL